MVLDTRLTPELKAEGLARELQNRLQGIRKELGLAYEDRIAVSVVGPASVIDALRPYAAKIAREVLSSSLELATSAERPAAADAREVEIEGETLRIVANKA